MNVERTIDVIYLQPDENKQVGYHVMNLNTGQIVNRRKFIPAPLPSIVQQLVELMAYDQGIKKIKFTNKKGIELPNVD